MSQELNGTPPRPARPPARVQRWMMLAAAVPAAIATVVILGFAALETGGYTPLSVHPDNLAEAAALGNAAETMRRLSFGDNPSRIEWVRSEIIASDPMRVTALEAAVFSRRLELIQLLDARGAVVGDETRRSLACLAADIGVGDISEFLRRDLAVECAPGAARDRILARSSSAEAP